MEDGANGLVGVCAASRVEVRGPGPGLGLVTARLPAMEDWTVLVTTNRWARVPRTRVHT